MNIIPVLTVLATLNASPQQLSLHNLAIQDNNSTQKEVFIGIAAPMPSLVQNQSDDMIIT